MIDNYALYLQYEARIMSNLEVERFHLEMGIKHKQ